MRAIIVTNPTREESMTCMAESHLSYINFSGEPKFTGQVAQLACCQRWGRDFNATDNLCGYSLGDEFLP